jgi:hypothetical protein
MKAAQQAIFGALDGYCAAATEPVSNAGAARWINGSSADSAFLADAKFSDLFRLTPRRLMARMDYDGRTYFSTLGFTGAAAPANLTEGEATPGLVSVVLAESLPRPVGTPFQVKDAVELSDARQDPSYDGHDCAAIADLFAPIRVFEGDAVEAAETWRAYFEICLGELSEMDTWIEPSTASALTKLTDLSALGLPYQTLCRSLFDADPAALFLALYRCLEALYAYTASVKLAAALGFAGPWQDVAIALEREIGWRPREEDSLAGLFAKCDPELLNELFDCIGEDRPEAATAVTSAARRIYKLRNSLVHYRPIHHTIEHRGIDWNELCVTLSLIIRAIYFDIFTTVPAEVAPGADPKNTGKLRTPTLGIGSEIATVSPPPHAQTGLKSDPSHARVEPRHRKLQVS